MEGRRGHSDSSRIFGGQPLRATDSAIKHAKSALVVQEMPLVIQPIRRAYPLAQSVRPSKIANTNGGHGRARRSGTAGGRC